MQGIRVDASSQGSTMVIPLVPIQRFLHRLGLDEYGVE